MVVYFNFINKIGDEVISIIFLMNIFLFLLMIEKTFIIYFNFCLRFFYRNFMS